MPAIDVNSNGNRKVNLMELAEGELPARILEDIAKMELTLTEVVEWDESKSPIHVTFDGKEIRISVNFELPVLRIVTILVGGVTTLLTIVELFQRLNSTL